MLLMGLYKTFPPKASEESLLAPKMLANVPEALSPKSASDGTRAAHV